MKSKYPYEEAASVMKVVSHPARLNIIALLETGRMNVMDIQIKLGLKQSITSQHLTAMANKGILRREKESNHVFYSIRKKEILNLLECIKGCCNSRG